MLTLGFCFLTEQCDTFERMSELEKCKMDNSKMDTFWVMRQLFFLETDLSKFKSDTFDRFWNRFQLSGYDVQDVRGDGGCYYRCLSLFYTGSEDSYNKYR